MCYLFTNYQSIKNAKQKIVYEKNKTEFEKNPAIVSLS